MCTWPNPVPDSENQALRTTIHNLAQALVDNVTDLLCEIDYYFCPANIVQTKRHVALPADVFHHVLSTVACPEVYLHRALSHCLDQTFKFRTVPGPYNVGTQAFLRSKELPLEFSDGVRKLGRMPRGLQFAIDIIMRVVWVQLTKSTSMTVCAFPVPRELKVLAVQHEWDQLAFAMTRAWLYPPVPIRPEDLHNQPTVLEIINMISMMDAPRLINHHTPRVLPKTSLFLREAARRCINTMIVVRICDSRLPAELRDIVYHELLLLKHLPKIDIFWQTPQLWSAVVAGQPHENAEGLAICGNYTCCCADAETRKFRRWAPSQKQYVQAHTVNMPGWHAWSPRAQPGWTISCRFPPGP